MWKYFHEKVLVAEKLFLKKFMTWLKNIELSGIHMPTAKQSTSTKHLKLLAY